MNKIPQTEEELRVIYWWNKRDRESKQFATTAEFGPKKSYKKLSYQQVKTIYKSWS